MINRFASIRATFNLNAFNSQQDRRCYWLLNRNRRRRIEAACEQGLDCLLRSTQRPDAERLRSYDPNIKPLILDVTQQDQVDAAFEQVRKEVGEEGLDALVNNAGLGILGPSEFTPISEFRRQYEINAFGMIRVTQAAMPLLRTGTPGRVVNVSSIAPNMKVPFGGVYCPLKGAVDSFSECFTMEVAKWGIKVSVLKPGPVRTAFSDTALDVAKEIRNRFDEGRNGVALGEPSQLTSFVEYEYLRHVHLSVV